MILSRESCVFKHLILVINLVSVASVTMTGISRFPATVSLILKLGDELKPNISTSAKVWKSDTEPDRPACTWAVNNSHRPAVNLATLNFVPIFSGSSYKKINCDRTRSQLAGQAFRPENCNRRFPIFQCISYHKHTHPQKNPLLHLFSSLMMTIKLWWIYSPS